MDKTMLYRVKVALLLLLLLSSCVEVEQYEDTPTGNFKALWHIIDTKYCFLDYTLGAMTGPHASRGSC